MKHKESRENEQLQRKLRLQFESLYKQKCQNYFNMLQTKYQTLKEAIETVFKHIQNDEVLSTMFNDRTTSVHMNERVKEIFSEVITHQREIIFKKLGTQITNLKFQNEQLQREIEKVKSSNENLERNFMTERQSLEKRSNHTTEELRKLREELGHYKSRAEELTAENKDLKYLIQNIKESHEASEREHEEINEYRMKLRQLESTVEDLKNQLKENQQKFQKKYQAKRREYKQKIESYKTVITQINNQRLETEEVVRRAEQENANINLEKKILALMREHQKKVLELRSTKDREKSQLEKMYELKMKDTQSHFQKLLEQKLTEMQDNAGRYFQRMKEQGANLERHLQHYQQHYVPIAEYQEEISKRDEIMILMKNKLDQFEEMSEEYLKKEEMLTTKIKDSEIVIGNWKQKTYTLEEANQQLIGKLKSYEQTNNIFKISEQKSKDQFGEYQRLVKKTKEDYEDLKHNYLKLEQEKSQHQSLLREKDRKIKDSCQEIQILLKKIKKLNESIEQEIQQRQALTLSQNQLKKQITNLQYKLKDKEMTFNLNTASWQSKSNNFQLQLKEKNKLLTDLQQKYQQMSSNYQQEKRKNYEVETLMKKYQMESRFYKEATEMQKNQGVSTAEEYRRVVNEKSQKVNQMQSEIQRKNTNIANLENQLKNQKEKSINDSKRAAMKIKKFTKSLSSQLESLRKENTSIINYLKAREAILKNDQSIFKSTFSKELIHLTMNHEHQSDKVAKNVRAEMNETMDKQVRTLKIENQEKVKEINEKMEGERAALKRQIKQRDNKLEEISKEQKKLMADLKKQTQLTQKSQKQYQSLLRKAQKQKESSQSRFKDILRQMKDENDQILKQYEDKKYLMQQEIQNLVNSLKRLKLETQAIQARHQQEKTSINSQLRTIREQEEVIQKVVQQKDLQIARTLKDYEASLESKRILENQNRGYVDNLNRKVQLIHELQISSHQITGQLNLLKNKCERITEENSELKRKLSQKEEQLQDILRNKSRFQSELKDIKGALSRSSKNNQLRALNELSMQTLQLSQKVNEMRKVSTYLQSKTPLRS